MKIYTSIFVTLILFFSFSTPASNEVRPQLPTIEEQIKTKRADNMVLLKLINFKTKYWSYEEYYRQADSVLPVQ